jgi:hypothetical protein
MSDIMHRSFDYKAAPDKEVTQVSRFKPNSTGYLLVAESEDAL